MEVPEKTGLLGVYIRLILPPTPPCWGMVVGLLLLLGYEFLLVPLLQATPLQGVRIIDPKLLLRPSPENGVAIIVVEGKKPTVRYLSID